MAMNIESGWVLKPKSGFMSVNIDFGCSCGQVHGGPFIEGALQSFAWHMLRRHEAHTFRELGQPWAQRREGGQSLSHFRWTPG